jgi:glycine/D-amino acid oxidase-like deaminating enzyme
VLLIASALLVCVFCRSSPAQEPIRILAKSSTLPCASVMHTISVCDELNLEKKDKLKPRKRKRRRCLFTRKKHAPKNINLRALFRLLDALLEHVDSTTEWQIQRPTSDRHRLRPVAPRDYPAEKDWWCGARNAFLCLLMAALKSNENGEKKERHVVVVGGGIAGVTAAHALVERWQNERAQNRPLRVTVLERDAGDAATLLNANTIVPGAATGCLAQRRTLVSLARDTGAQWLAKPKHALVRQLRMWRGSDSDPATMSRVHDPLVDFAEVPPYFRMSLWNCLRNSDDRAYFLRFLRHFLSTALQTDDMKAAQRDEFAVRIAAASRHYLVARHERDPTSLPGLTRGFLALFRSDAAAHAAIAEVEGVGQMACLVGNVRSEPCQAMQPRVSHFPVEGGVSNSVPGGLVWTASRPFSLHAVFRGNDASAHCAGFVERMAADCEQRGVEFRHGDAGTVKSVARRPAGAYSVHTADGQNIDADAVVLAAGIATPKIANTLGIADKCPTYPMRGFSLTVARDGDSDTTELKLLRFPMSVDHVYISSTVDNTARLAGFGEFVGYPATARSAWSHAPRVLSRYALLLFPDAKESAVPENARACFRPVSPDDIPIVGETRAAPNVFFHTGHGTMGWTMSYATAYCLAQVMVEKLNRDAVGSADFDLPDGRKIRRDILSPDRF